MFLNKVTKHYCESWYYFSLQTYNYSVTAQISPRQSAHRDFSNPSYVYPQVFRY